MMLVDGVLHFDFSLNTIFELLDFEINIGVFDDLTLLSTKINRNMLLLLSFFRLSNSCFCQITELPISSDHK